jgi:glycosyltransferase involved in cell wall biosynthesis
MEKVLFLMKAREFGGLEIVLLDWFSRIEYSKVAVALCCYGTDTLAKKLATNVTAVESVKLTVPDSEPFRRAFPQWLRLFSSIRPDKIVILEAVVSEFDVTPVLAAWWSNRRDVFLFEANWGRATLPPSSMVKRKLHYGFLPGMGLYRYKEILAQRLRGRLARHTFVVSQGIKDNLVAKFGYPAARTSVLYHGVDVKRFQPSLAERLKYRQAFGIPSNATVIVSHGRLVQRKRVDRILKAFEALSAEHADLWLLLTSYGPLQREIEQFVASIRDFRRIKLVGFQEDPSSLLKASDIYVLASNDEGFGIALVEALATGLLCVATRGPGPSDILTDGENGLIVEPTEDGVLDGLRRALNLNQGERDRCVQRARETVETRFEIGAAIGKALDALEIPRR